jgi:peptide/nickel transport system permease protein
MLRLCVRRLSASVVTLVLVAIGIFVRLRVLPGNPAAVLAGGRPGLTAAQLAAVTRGLGLDKSLPDQFFSWIVGVAHGNFGTSYFSSVSVASLLHSAFAPTLELAILATLATAVVTAPLALVAGLSRDGRLDRMILALSTVALSLPTFWLGIMLVWAAAVEAHILPGRGYVSFTSNPIESLKLAILPVTTLTVGVIAPTYRVLRASLIEVLDSDYVRTAEGKGLLWRDAVTRHAFPNALVPAIAVLGVNTGQMLGGIVIVEYIFGWPGLGSLALSSFLQHDYPVAQGVVLLAALAFLVVSFVVDVVSALVDPRLR